MNQAPVSIRLKDEATFVKDEDGEGDDDQKEEERGKHDQLQHPDAPEIMIDHVKIKDEQKKSFS